MQVHLVECHTYSLLTFALMMVSIVNASTNVDVVRGATDFVAAPQRAVLVLITSLARKESLLMSLTKVAPVPLSVLTVTGSRASQVVGGC